MTDFHSQWLRAVDRELEPYGLEGKEYQAAMDDIAVPVHSFSVGDHVISELSGRTGVVQRVNTTVVLVAYDDHRSNVDFNEAPEAWVPVGVLRKRDPDKSSLTLPKSGVAFRGRPIEDLSHAELVEAFKDLLDRYNAFFSPEEIRVRAMGRVAALKKEGAS